MNIPPHDLNAEKSVLSAIMQDSSVMDMVLNKTKKLGLKIWYHEPHEIIFKAMECLYEKNDPLDIITIENELRTKDNLNKANGAPYLVEVYQYSPSSANIETHLNIIIEKSIYRKLIALGNRLMKQCYAEEDEALNILNNHENNIGEILGYKLGKEVIKISDIIPSAIENIEKAYHKEEGIIGIPSGYQDLDDMTAGFQNGDMIVLAGRPSHGKTAFVLNIVRNMALNQDCPIGFFSLEMTDLSLVYRLMSMQSQIDLHNMRRGKLSESALINLVNGISVYHNSHVYIDDTPNISIFELKAKAKQMQRLYGIKLLIVDYLQLVRAPERINDEQKEIKFISLQLKSLAKNLDIPIIVISQLSRELERHSKPREPRLSDLRGSGAIEQDADVVIFVWNPEVAGIEYWPDKESTTNTAELIIGKQRNGPIGKIRMVFLRENGLFLQKTHDDVGF